MAKKKKKHKILKILYLIFAIIVIIAGIYYENGYTDINTFFGDVKAIITGQIQENENKKYVKTTPTSARVYKQVDGNLEMHIIDVGQRR